MKFNKVLLMGFLASSLLLSGCFGKTNKNGDKGEGSSGNESQGSSGSIDNNSQVSKETFTSLITHLGIMDPTANVTIDIAEKDISEDKFIDREWYEHEEQFKHIVENPSSCLTDWEDVTHQIKIAGNIRTLDNVQGSIGTGYQFLSSEYNEYNKEYSWDFYYKGQYDMTLKETQSLYVGELFWEYTLFELFNYDDFTYDSEKGVYHLDSLVTMADNRTPITPWFQGFVADISLKFENNKLVEYSYFTESQYSYYDEEYGGRRWPSGTLSLFTATLKDYGTTTASLPTDISTPPVQQ